VKRMMLNSTAINDVFEILSELRNELKELKLLYRELVDRLIPVEAANYSPRDSQRIIGRSTASIPLTSFLLMVLES